MVPKGGVECLFRSSVYQHLTPLGDRGNIPVPNQRADPAIKEQQSNKQRKTREGE